MIAPQQISRSVQLLVEGNDQRNFFEALVKDMYRDDIQVQNFGGVNDLRTFLSLWSRLLDSSKIRSVGIVRDAEISAQAAFQSVQGALKNAGLDVPDRPRQLTNSSPNISVLILPDDNNSGMLETLLCRTFTDTQMNSCINEFFECIQTATTSKLHRPDKARAHAYIVTQRDPHISVGVAALRGYWTLDHPALSSVRQFLQTL